MFKYNYDNIKKEITIIKDYNYCDPSFVITINNKKKVVKAILNNNKATILIDFFNFDSITVSDCFDTETFKHYSQSQSKSQECFNYDISHSYSNKKLNIHLTSIELLKKDMELIFTKDLNRSVIWRTGSNVLDVQFINSIDNNIEKNINFCINNKPYSINLIDIQKLPTSCIYAGSNFLKLNCVAIVDIDIKTNIGNFTISKNESGLKIDDNVSYISAYYKGTLLFEQTFKKDKPFVYFYVEDSNIYLKLSYLSIEDITIIVNSYTYIIKQGQEKVFIGQKMTSIIKYTINNIKNATIGENSSILI